eukprot:CAMPEP_0182868834 /NCGR_PEP_ID=MMETSP0034_2-20130328/9559_1 /TAXON_ID=156128 /ORGANISM="Nephroselmis pyriformis, Strain CCMP717" /LENGTH=67 /DNA_ID=CAMNT_0025001255 /DNA_START=45 /DNA_END=245 /DNA_ORIENTATION=+
MISLSASRVAELTSEAAAREPGPTTAAGLRVTSRSSPDSQRRPLPNASEVPVVGEAALPLVKPPSPP